MIKSDVAHHHHYFTYSPDADQPGWLVNHIIVFFAHDPWAVMRYAGRLARNAVPAIPEAGHN